MQFALIKKEIAEDPEKIGYAGKSDTEIANLLNAKTRSRLEMLPVAESLSFLMRHDLLRKIDATPIDSPIYSIVNGIRASFGVGAVQLNRPEVQFALSQLVSAQFITQEQKEEILAIATVKVSRAEELGIVEEVWAAHIAEARGQ